MGRKAKKGCDLFDESNPVSKVKLPSAESRLPQTRGRSKEEACTSLPDRLKTQKDELRPDKHKTNSPPSTSGESSTQKPLTPCIKVNIPTFTNGTTTKECSTRNQLLLHSSEHASSSCDQRKKREKASVRKQRAPRNISSVHKRGRVLFHHNLRARTKATRATASLIAAGRQLVCIGSPSVNSKSVNADELQAPKQDINKPSQAPVIKSKHTKTSRSNGCEVNMRAARARYQEGKVANQKAAANTARPSFTSPPPTNLMTISPAPSPSSAYLNAATKQWSDYAKTASTTKAQQSLRPFARRNPRGGRMIQSSQVTGPRQHAGPVARPNCDWKDWAEVHVKLHGLTGT